MYSKKHNLLFVHIPKTGGTAVSSYMQNLNDPSVNEYYEKPMQISFLKKTINIDRLICDTYTHIPLNSYKFLLNDEQFNTSIKFTVIRDPLSKLKSLYYFLKDHNWLNIEIEEILPILYESLKMIKSRGYAQDHTFRLNEDGSIKIDINDPNAKREYVKKYKMLAIDNLFDTISITKQTEFFDIENDNINILRLENLQQDFNNFTEKYSLPKYNIPLMNKSSSSNIDDKTFFRLLIKNHPIEMVKYVFEYYKDDYKLLNYNLPGNMIL